MEDELALYSSVRVIPPYSLSHVIGCWKSHLRVWQDIVKSGYQTAMIFEDDIDLPLNIHAIMRTTIDILSANSSRSVPGSKDPGYDLVFVGGCGLRESTNPPLTSDFRLLRKSYWPSCLHAYMLTIDSARKLLQLFSTAISDPIDVSITEYVRNGTLRSYSLHPSVITQRRDLTPEGASWNYDVFKVPKYSLLEHLAKYGHVYSVDEAKNMGL
ncbi:hypothetical protein EV182_008449 [Spiromyces aspiralis]|uniref:Uncharacterized protein n=1 Tax=Spiromyces aspiralis TaxID=68401 RepID=A0ACC1HKK1_9FUNG|nr:hypothetical protein EV182_008449 [Spiromyces aspiralis]